MESNEYAITQLIPKPIQCSIQSLVRLCELMKGNYKEHVKPLQKAYKVLYF